MSASGRSSPETYTTSPLVMTPAGRRQVPKIPARSQEKTPAEHDPTELERQRRAIIAGSRRLQQQTTEPATNVSGFGGPLPSRPHADAGLLPRRQSTTQASSSASSLPAVTSMVEARRSPDQIQAGRYTVPRGTQQQLIDEYHRRKLKKETEAANKRRLQQRQERAHRRSARTTEAEGARPQQQQLPTRPRSQSPKGAGNGRSRFVEKFF